MFVKEFPEVFSRVRLYKLYSKRNSQPAGNIMVNLHWARKIAIDNNIIFFHLPEHVQTIEYLNYKDAEQEFAAIHKLLNKAPNHMHSE